MWAQTAATMFADSSWSGQGMGLLSDSFCSSTLSLIHSKHCCDIHLSKLSLISTLQHAAALLANRAALAQNMNNVHPKTKVSGSTHGTQ